MGGRVGDDVHDRTGVPAAMSERPGDCGRAGNRPLARGNHGKVCPCRDLRRFRARSCCDRGDL